MGEARLVAEIERIVVPLGFAPSQNLLFCAATRNLIEPFPWVVQPGHDVHLERDCTDLTVHLERGRIEEVTVEHQDVGDLLADVVDGAAAARYRESVPGPLADAAPVLLDSLRALFRQG